MRTIPLALISLVGQTLSTGIAAQAPTTTKMESQVVATGEPGMRFIVSPDQEAYTVHPFGRSYAGPGTTVYNPTFTPDGRHLWR
ncbi:MAG TPA: hypothetical protein VHE78_15405 [Gemmatimonadaceae bacterium]|nr:hypothetical protein [Gemmatimonadaceae bacterium]